MILLKRLKMINNFTSQDGKFSLYHGDCFEMLPQFKGEFDLIFADPPYFLSNDGLSIQNGKIVSVNKGDWDKSYGIDERCMGFSSDCAVGKNTRKTPDAKAIATSCATNLDGDK